MGKERISMQNIRVIKKMFKMNEVGIAIPLVIISLVVGIINPIFFSIDNLANLLKTTSFQYIIAIAMTFVLIGAGLDLSVGAIVALGGIVTGLCLRAGVPIVFSFIAGLLLGLIFGFINGLIIVRFKLPSLIATIGTQYIAQGLVLGITHGTPIFPLPEAFNKIGGGEVFGISNVIPIAIALGIIANFVLKHTAFGRAVYAVGGNEETARLSGINVGKIKISTYLLTGVSSALCGVLMAGRLASAQPIAGQGYEFAVISAVIIGGTSMFGGKGSILGTTIGMIMMNVISNGMVLARVSAYWQKVVIGIIIILAVGIDAYKGKKEGSLKI